MNVIVAVTNLTSVPQTYSGNLCAPVYQVFNAAGLNTDTTTVFCATVLTPPTTLAPGAQVVSASTWSTVDRYTSAPLPPGRYTIRGTFSGSGVENYPYVVQLIP